MAVERDKGEARKAPEPRPRKPQPKIEPSEWQPDAVIDPVPAERDDVPGPP